MKLSKSLTLAAAATTLTAAATFAPVASAELSGSVGIANIYLWRGFDLGVGEGTPAVSGDISYSIAGFYTGAWTSSGDASAGTEYDLYAGWGMDITDWLSVDLSAWTYVYPNGPTDNLGDLSEGILGVGIGPVDITYYKNIAGNSEYQYATIGAGFGAFSALVGSQMAGDDSDYIHLDLSYAYNDNLSFTVSKIVDEDTEGMYDDSANFVVSYSIPIE